MNILSILLFIPSLLYDIFLTIINTQNWYDRIDDTIVLGALPFSSLASKLISQENIKAVISLSENYEQWFANGKKQWESCNVQFLQLPTANIFEVPNEKDLRQGVEFIKQFSKHLSTDNNVSKSKPSIYVHCKGERTRSATLVTCYLMEKHGWDPIQSIAFIKKKRPQVLFFKGHRSILWKYYTSIQKFSQ